MKPLKNQNFVRAGIILPGIPSGPGSLIGGTIYGGVTGGTGSSNGGLGYPPGGITLLGSTAGQKSGLGPGP